MTHCYVQACSSKTAKTIGNYTLGTKITKIGGLYITDVYFDTLVERIDEMIEKQPNYQF